MQIMLLTTLMDQLTHSPSDLSSNNVSASSRERKGTQPSIQLILTLILSTWHYKYKTSTHTTQPHGTWHHSTMTGKHTGHARVRTLHKTWETLPNLQGCGTPRVWSREHQYTPLQGCVRHTTYILHILPTSAPVECTHGTTEGCAYAHDTTWCTCF